MTSEPDPSTSTACDDATVRLVGLLRRNDPEAARALNDQYRQALVRFCRGYLGDTSQAEDAVQDICCKILAAEDVPDHFRPWTYKIARHHCLNLLRERANRKDNASLPSPSHVLDELTGHLTRLVREERQERLADLVRTLSVAQSEALRLRYVENLSREEIAAVLEISEKTVKSRIYEGLRTLRAQIGAFDET